MQALALQVGDSFVDVPPDEWRKMKPRDRHKRTVWVVTKVEAIAPPVCQGQVHLAVRSIQRGFTSHWCIEGVTEVTQVTG